MGHPANPVQAYRDLLATSPTTHPEQPLLTFNSGRAKMVVTLPMLVNSLNIFLEALQMDTVLYSLHSLGGMVGVPRQPTREAQTRMTLRDTDCGPRMLFGSTSLPLVWLFPRWQRHWQCPWSKPASPSPTPTSLIFPPLWHRCFSPAHKLFSMLWTLILIHRWLVGAPSPEPGPTLNCPT